ncbi:DUF1707 domain-containing protein [Saccharothrix syringae]|uniref:DUF1707 domain-containing protein n=1 Tax=Saccharothrix syringae TaxID=103733 RepID=UPI000690D7C5|nr:DUF1707 domain-containing protein [Saccharothrix syringae]
MTEPHFKAADDDRSVVAERLARALAEGRLTRAEYDARHRAIGEARTYSELHRLTADLPDDPTRPAPVWQDASSMAAKPTPPADDQRPTWQDAHQGPTRQDAPPPGTARPEPVRQDAPPRAAARPEPVWQDAPRPGAGHQRPSAHIGADLPPLPPRREPPPVPAKRSKTTVFLVVLTVLWLFASAINLLIWAIVNGTSETSVYPWWLWVAGPLGVVVVTAHLVRFGLKR